MAARLKDRNAFIPGGFRFYVAQSKWSSPPGASFDTVVRMTIDHLRVNQSILQALGWDLEYNAMAHRIDTYNAAICKQHNWLNFILDDEEPLPKSIARSQAKPVARLAAGVAVLSEMFGPEGPVKDQKLVNERALICTTCPKNEKGDWTRFFTVPAQAIVRRTLRAVKDMDLHSDYDKDLQVCSACGCPLAGKVHAKIHHIVRHIPKEDFDALDARCWIRAEKADMK